MISSIEIEDLRGIRSGRLDGLAPLTILTGLNASGKSTVLDALLIAASPDPGEAVAMAVERHPAVLGGARWLTSATGGPASLTVKTCAGSEWSRRLEWNGHCNEEGLKEGLRSRDARPPFSMVQVTESGSGNVWVVAFSSDSKHEEGKRGRGLTDVPFVRLVDPGLPIPLHRTFTDAARTGRRDEVDALLADLVPDFERLEILVEDGDTPSLFLKSADTSIPVGLAGDGIQAFVQLALEIAVAPEGLVLVEEPEVYQHPKAFWQTARVLLANVRRGVQVILSTHSLELVDALLAEASPDDLAKMALFNLRLDKGELHSGRRAGEDIAFARQTLETDLR